MIVWEATIDNNTWKAQVVRVDSYNGTLEIYRVEPEEKVYSEDVSLSYGAIFGPDVADVAYWQEKTIEVVDNQ